MIPSSHPTAWTFHWHSSHLDGVSHHAPGRQQTSSHGFAYRPAVEKEYRGVPVVKLPPPMALNASLDEVLSARASCRRFSSDTPVTLEEVATMLARTYGIQDRVQMDQVALHTRPVPSGGGRYPLEVYVLVRQLEGLRRGVYHYGARRHQLEQIRGPFPWSRLVESFLHQPYLEQASLMILFSGVALRTLSKYHSRGYRVLLFEAGSAAHHLGLVATGLDLGSLQLGAFLDDRVAALLGLDLAVELPLSCVALGRAATTDRTAVRQPDAWRSY